MQISESYGYSFNGNANAQGKASQQFKEGGMVADLSGNAQIQSKGYINSDFKVQSQYTVTLAKWQMLVASGGEDIHYKLVVLPHDDENEQESGYYEYYIVIQAGRGTPVHIEEMEIGGMFRHTIPLWFDSYEGLSVTVGDIWITPPRYMPPGTSHLPAPASRRAYAALLSHSASITNGRVLSSTYSRLPRPPVTDSTTTGRPRR